MGKLHELLAVEPDLKAGAQKALSQTKVVFSSGEKLAGQIRTYVPLEEEGESFPDERKELTSTVKAEWGTFREAFGRYVDAVAQKEVTNQSTVADVVVDGRILLKNLPATALLNLEARLGEVLELYRLAPTNDPAERWTWDDQNGYWVSDPRTTFRTQKKMRAQVLYEATKEHPAQVQTYTDDIRVGTWTTVIRSGMLSPVSKKIALDRIEALIRAVKEARQRANDIEAEKTKVADVLFDYIEKGAVLS